MPWGAIASVAGSLLAGDAASNSADAANSAQQAATDAAIREQKRQFDLSRADLKPWLRTGTAANSKLAELMGLDVASFAPEKSQENFDAAAYLAANPDVNAQAIQNAGNISPRDFAWNHYQNFGQSEGRQFTGNADYMAQLAQAEQYKKHPPSDYGSLLKPFTLADYVADPGYQFRLSEGQKAIDAAARARGLYDSGGALKELTKYGSDLASQEYGNAYNRFNNDKTTIYNRLAGVSGTGQQTAGNLANLGTAYAGNLGNLYTNMGNADAANAIAQGQARASTYAGIANGISGYFKNRMDQQNREKYGTKPIYIYST